ncbi:hypothetical protein Y032_0008g15 [Ancylostoma ceylanicum]|uniref:Uncharacterized protein n=1 Tax=Ancylostoma ceylanicum TaxID=53326 RepID=A0A016VJD8_9BILA|nr:hypothetical protein Y032_0008g15 [Ancylostoma ceylanicum]
MPLYDDDDSPPHGKGTFSPPRGKDNIQKSLMYVYPKWRTRLSEHNESLSFGVGFVLKEAATKTTAEITADALQLKFLHFCFVS